MRLGINGRFRAARITGVQRVAHALLKRLPHLTPCTLFLPHGSVPPADLPPHVRVCTGRLRGHAWEQLELPGVARADGCDVMLHLAGTVPRGGPPGIALLHDVLPLTNPEWFSRRYVAWFRYAVGRNARRTARIITVSSWSADEIRRALRMPTRRVTVIPQAVAPFDAPAPAEEVVRIRDELRLPDRYLLALGWGDPRKNVSFLFRVRDTWHATGEAPPVLVVVGAALPRVHGRPPERPADPDIHLLGHVEDRVLHALYTGATALCFPSLAEGHGRPPLEAAACGAPAVAAPYTAALEVLGERADIVPLDADAWVAALRSLERDPSRRAANVEHLRSRTRHLTWDASAQAVLNACSAVAGRRGVP
jgi:glycosyltransferase involved in cell wall biosynthesis